MAELSWAPGAPLKCAFTAGPEGIAVVMKIRLPQITGVEWPLPGRGVFQRMFLVSLHSVGGLPVGATPVASGPRHWGQLELAGSTATARIGQQAKETRNRQFKTARRDICKAGRP